jgi:heme exporter protein D
MKELLVAAQEFHAAYVAGTPDARFFLWFWIALILGTMLFMAMIERRQAYLRKVRRQRQYKRMMQGLEIRKFNLGR